MIKWQTRLSQAISFWRANSGQGMLGAAGIVIGLVGLVIASAIGEGAKADMAQYTDSMGAGVVFIRSASHLDDRLSKRLNLLFDGKLVASAGLLVTSRSLRFHDTTLESTRTVLTEPDYVTALHLRTLQGRFLQSVDLQTDRQVVVLSKSLANSLTPSGAILGEEILLASRWYRVIGVTAENHEGPTAYIPRVRELPQEYVVRFDSEKSLLANQTLLHRSLALANNASNVEAEIILPLQALRDQQHLQLLLQRVLGGFAIVVLTLGGLSVTNTMLMSVMTRHHEIGLRLALGATKHDIIAQFVTESLVICGVGGFAATGFGALLVLAVSPWLSWSLVVNANVIVLAMIATIIVSAAAGGIPALRASQVPPANVLS